jgi:iron complex transport system ATP-binding protein
MIEIRHASVHRGTKTLLNNVSLAIRPGEVLAVLGPNGAGKSTLLRIAAGELTPELGETWIDGRPLESVPRLELARIRAVLPQASSVGFPACAEDIVALGRSPHYGVCDQLAHRRAVERALAWVDIGSLSQRNYGTLSGGEQQRVQLARVLAQIGIEENGSNPRYLLLDEPTTSLDLAHQHAILDIARRLSRRNVGVLAVLHDLNLAAAYADQIVLLKQGEICAEGLSDDVLEPQTIRDVFGIAARVIDVPDLGRFIASEPLQSLG